MCPAAWHLFQTNTQTETQTVWREQEREEREKKVYIIISFLNFHPRSLRLHTFLIHFIAAICLVNSQHVHRLGNEVAASITHFLHAEPLVLANEAAAVLISGECIPFHPAVSLSFHCS